MQPMGNIPVRESEGMIEQEEIIFTEYFSARTPLKFALVLTVSIFCSAYPPPSLSASVYPCLNLYTSLWYRWFHFIRDKTAFGGTD